MVAQTGLYKLTYQDLHSSGFPVQIVDPRKIQLFFRGREMAIEMAGQLDARFDPEDYIVFYGQRNDGTLDAPLYVSPEAQPHHYHNLFSDSAAYFLTWRLDNQNGIRVQNFFENNVDNLPAEKFFVAENILLETSNYCAGRTYPEGSDGFSQLASFDYGEGWTGDRVRDGQKEDFVVKSLNNLQPDGPKPSIEILLSGRNNRRHKVELLAGASPSTLRSLGEIEFDFYNVHKLSESLEWSDISPAGELHVQVFVKGFGDGIPDYVSLSYIRVLAPRHWKIEKDTFYLAELAPNPGNKSFLRIGNNLPALTIYDVTDPFQPIRIGYNHGGGLSTAIVDNTSTERLLAIQGSQFLSAPVRKISFPLISPANYNYLIITHRDLMQPSSAFPNPVQAYADYRASFQGGSLKPLVMEIDQVYDQFGFGEKTPLAIRRFCAYMMTGGDQKYLFLVGKGLDMNYNYYRQDLKTYEFRNYVPAAGFPASDIQFTAGLGNSQYEPGIPTGRITAQKPMDVEVYLNKIKEMEGQPYNALWRKQLIHLSGGYSASEMTLFKQYSNQFRNVAEGDYLGGRADVISKTTNNSTELINISGEINSGKVMVMFFGHSGGLLTDLDIGMVSDDGYGYQNKGRYPVFLINGCNAGQIFATATTLGDDWILTPDRGAIAFLASPTLGYAGYLRRYTDFFYQVAFSDSIFINKPIGLVLQETSRRFMENAPITPLYITQAQELILHGDPFYRMFAAEQPDYAIGDTDLMIRSFNGDKISSATDSFEIGVVVRNLGRTTWKPLQIAVERTPDNGETVLYDPKAFPAVKYLDTLWYTIDNRGYEGFGKNNFRVILDIADSIPELNESNNSASFNYFIPSHTVRNVLPYDCAIINQTTVELIGQSTNLLDNERDYIIEMDTSANFNTAFKKQWTLNAKILARKQVELLNIDSLAYFWRIRFANPLPQEDDGWAVGSFSYIRNATEGWAQTKYSQLKRNSISGLTPLDKTNEFVFEETKTVIELKTYGPNHPDFDFDDVELSINSLPYIFTSRFCTNHSLNAAAFDKSSTIPYQGLNFGGWDILDRRSCGRRPQVVNNFLNNEIENPSYYYLNQFIDNIQEGDYVLLFSIGNVTFENWPEEVKAKVNEIGVSPELFTKLRNSYPVVILGKKGAPAGSALEVMADLESSLAPGSQQLSLSHVLTGKYTDGMITTPPIGPAVRWDKLFANVHLPDLFEDEEFSINIEGIASNNESSVLYTGIEEDEVDLSGINPSEYPYLQLKFHVRDHQRFTPAILKSWVVAFESAPEGILTVANGQPQFPGHRQEGEPHSLTFMFDNLSQKDFADSIPVHINNFSVETRTTDNFQIKIPPPKAGDAIPILVTVSTQGKTGNNNLKVEANPRILTEQHYFNNLIAIDDFLTVKKDDANPILEVIVDGRHIMNGDIVSPSPFIVARLKDENKFLLKTDTSNVSILIKKDCDGCPFKRINFSDPNVKWTPASTNRDFQVEYQSERLDDGMYILQAQAADASGNNSGANPLRVRFEVVNESSITNFYPYPNPFSTNVRFVFTLTGSEIPDKIKIRIMTISGHIVREINQDELGPLHIGHNISQFAWDGRDEFGDRLANGVYLYKALIENNGESLERRETSADRAFKNGFGKMYLLR